ncbi:MAG: InlB B-repeat-containing protein, partial [Bacillota bacterium]
MRRTIRHKSSRFIPLLLVAVMIFGMLQMQVLAAGIDTVPVTMTDEIDTNDQTNAGEVETNSISEEPLAGAEAVVQEEAVITASEQPFGLDPEEETCLVAFDPDDGKTGYKDFFKITVPIDGTVTGKPADPSRDGYFFKGWYAYLDENHNPVLWNFETDTVQENTTLWAAWEKGCIVAFDPDDGKTGYKDFFKITVPIDSTVTEKPADPSRDGYLFKGWYAYLDENDNPVLWNFETNTVVENTTLWAAWEEACLVVFDPDDGE